MCVNVKLKWHLIAKKTVMQNSDNPLKIIKTFGTLQHLLEGNPNGYNDASYTYKDLKLIGTDFKDL